MIELPILGDITVREQAWITKKLGKQSTFLEIARISNKVAKAQRIDPLAAHRFLTKVISDSLGGGGTQEFSAKEEGWRLKYAREIEELSTFLLTNQFERQTVTAAALIRFRIEGMEDYDVDDARELPQNLVQEIYAFALTEQTEEDEEPVEDPAEAAQVLEESLKKS